MLVIPATWEAAAGGLLETSLGKNNIVLAPKQKNLVGPDNTGLCFFIDGLALQLPTSSKKELSCITTNVVHNDRPKGGICSYIVFSARGY